MEVGLSSFPVGTGWTTQPQLGKTQPGVHMLPVFRLPEVRKSPSGGFLRRLPREETQRERECRVKEAYELKKMKTALGLSDRDLEALEEELLPERERTGGRLALKHEKNIDIDLEKGSQELLYGPGGLGKEEGSFTFSASGKRRRRSVDEMQEGRGCGRSSRRTERRTDVRRRDKQIYLSPGLYPPTPRVLRRTGHSSLRAELNASAALSIRSRGSGKRIGAWTSPSEITCLGGTAGSVLGMTATTEQLVAAAADVGMVNLLELRRELGRSVGQAS